MRPAFSLLTLLSLVLTAGIACTSSEPSGNAGERPDLVYVQRDTATSLWSIHGYKEGLGSWEIAPGPAGLPRPAGDLLRVRPGTGELLYVSEDPGRGGYLLLDPASGRLRQLPLPGVVQSWSPQGDLLLTSVAGVATVVTVDGAERATVPTCSPPASCGVPHWVPAGDAFVVHRRPPRGEADLWLVPLDGSAEVNLTQTPAASEIGPSSDPDGQHLVYERETDFTLVVANADGSEPRPLLAPVGLGNFPWSPDGATVAADASIGGESGLWLIPLDGAPRLVTPPGERLVVVSHIAWSPDGTRLAYEAFDGTAGDAPGVFVIKADGTERRQVNVPGLPAGAVDWLPALP
jgi:dipeptidyl aminopeptidase/acylaminoacyl peptidase